MKRVKAWIVLDHRDRSFLRAMESKRSAMLYATGFPQDNIVVRGHVEFDEGKPKKRRAKR